MDTVLNVVTKTIDDTKIGGWARAITATGLGALAGSGWFNSLIPFFDNFKEVIAAVVSAVAVSAWSWLAKVYTPKEKEIIVIKK